MSAFIDDFSRGTVMRRHHLEALDLPTFRQSNEKRDLQIGAKFRVVKFQVFDVRRRYGHGGERVETRGLHVIKVDGDLKVKPYK